MLNWIPGLLTNKYGGDVILHHYFNLRWFKYNFGVPDSPLRPSLIRVTCSYLISSSEEGPAAEAAQSSIVQVVIVWHLCFILKNKKFGFLLQFIKKT